MSSPVRRVHTRRKARRLGLISTLAILLGLTITTTANPAAATETARSGFAGTVALDNCSGSVVAPTNAAPEDPAYVMSNGHCLEGGFPGKNEVIVDQPSDREFDLLNDSGDRIGALTAESLAYATMVDTDVSLYRLTSTYGEISDEYGINPLPLSDKHPEAGTDITVVSGYWKETYSCQIDGFVPEMREDGYVWKDSIRYTPQCRTVGGTSGSPILDDATGEVVGVNNTGNEDGQECTLNNPCEVDENGEVTVREGTNYGEQTYLINDCVAEGNRVDLESPGCALPKP